jgi:hypothetical protein
MHAGMSWFNAAEQYSPCPDTLACSLCHSTRCAMASGSVGASNVRAVSDAGAEQPSSSSAGDPQTVGQRTRKRKARIDIDDEIEEANRISDMLKKVQKRAKTMQRSSKKAKQRLVVKASKLRAEDLERIAVLKRCGLFVSEDTSNPNVTVSEDCQAEPLDRATKGNVQRKMADIIAQTDGSAGLLNVIHRTYKAETGAARSEIPIAGSVCHVPALIPTGCPLGKHHNELPPTRVDDAEEAAVEAELSAISKDFE